MRHVGRALRRPRPCIRGGPVSRSACGESSIDDVAAFWNRRGEDRWLVMRRGWTEWTSRQLRRLDAESNTRCRWRAADGATVLEALEALRDATTKKWWGLSQQAQGADGDRAPWAATAPMHSPWRWVLTSQPVCKSYMHVCTPALGGTRRSRRPRAAHGGSRRRLEAHLLEA